LATDEQKREFGNNLKGLLVSEGNNLGSGMTARIKSMRVEGMDRPIAVKYLLTPTQKTLSVDGEHDMLREVETITEIESTEKQMGVGEYMRVPHPHFFYKRGALQCYGMQQVQGIALDKIGEPGSIYNPDRDTAIAAFRNRFKSSDEEAALYKEISAFMTGMHRVCLHGDIKLANLMINTEGILYLIDFGQSVSMQDQSEKTRDQFENLKVEEVEQVIECVRHILKLVRSYDVPLAA
jgi:serine/threonine protein kinase